LFLSNISTGRSVGAQTTPSGYLTPAIDGEETSYFEWLGAGSLEIRKLVGAMHPGDRRASVLTLVQFGFDREHLYVRLDADRRAADLLAEGYEFSLKFLHPEGLRFSVRKTIGTLSGSFWDRRLKAPHWVERGPGGTTVAAGSVLEVAVPLVDLAAKPGDVVAFFVAVYDVDNTELERHPAHRPIESEVPDEQFEARNWTA
jgi:hypothetical protein